MPEDEEGDGVGGGEATGLSHNPLLIDRPDLCADFSKGVMWEWTLFAKSFHPTLATVASVPSAAISSSVVNSVPMVLLDRYDSSGGGFNPGPVEPENSDVCGGGSGRGKKRRRDRRDRMDDVPEMFRQQHREDVCDVGAMIAKRYCVSDGKKEKVSESVG